MSFQAYIDNIKTKTGKTPEDFKKLAEKKGLLKPGVKAMEIVAWLKKDHGLFYDRSPIYTLALANWLGHPAIIPSAGESSSGPARASTAQKEITSDTNNAKMADMK